MIWKVKRTYADAAASTPLSAGARAELLRLLDLYGNPGALHKEAVAAKAALERARGRVAKAIGAHADEILFTSGGTEGNNLSLAGALRPLLQQHGSVHAITSAIEHASVLEPLRALKDEGLELTELPVNDAGLISLSQLRESITEKTALISVQFINSEVGTIEPIKEIAKTVRSERKRRTERLRQTTTAASLPLLFHCDASQAPLWKTVNVEKLGVDLLVLDAQKAMGPKGIGAVYVRRSVALAAQLLGGGQERGLRSGTENVPLAGSFAVALEEAQAGVDERYGRIASVRNALLEEILRRLPDAQVNGAAGDERAVNNLNISIPNLDGEMAVIALDALGVAASTRSACDASEEEPSHVLVALSLPPERVKGAIRFTLLPTARKRDAVRIAEALFEAASRYRAQK